MDLAIAMGIADNRNQLHVLPQPAAAARYLPSPPQQSIAIDKTLQHWMESTQTGQGTCGPVTAGWSPDDVKPRAVGR